jgi:hypothetical protein
MFTVKSICTLIGKISRKILIQWEGQAQSGRDFQHFPQILAIASGFG